ncbi:RING finger protein 151-like [Polyodon spathula]|uniref:RING finger protein 151-like n=1 Tax=Polyodon spathula TaxID=7913 RepID=UPI001B7E6588|nr:RING finger protein 151-like [Polyodon spathula]
MTVNDPSTSGGYDLEQFVEVPDQDLVCSICHGVLRCPVRIACSHNVKTSPIVKCSHISVKHLSPSRQETCPCCRKVVHRQLMFVVYKLSKSISRLKIKCKNEIHGCCATFPLSDQYSHSTACDFKVISCPNEGCKVEVLRKELARHLQSCDFWREPCMMGCGTVLTHQTHAQHNCYRELKREFEAQQSTHKAIAVKLKKKLSKMQSTMLQMRRQVSLICDSLEVMDDEDDEEEDEHAGSSNAESSADV